MRVATAGLVVAVLAAVGTACTGEDDYGVVCVPGQQGSVDPQGTHFQYVVSAVDIPQDAAQIWDLSLNLDGDAMNRPDNQLGRALEALVGLTTTVDYQAAATAGIDSGAAIVLVDVLATSITMASGVGAWLIPGSNPSVEPCDGTGCGHHLDGAASFDRGAAVSTEPSVVGSVLGAQLWAGPGRVAIELPVFPDGTTVSLMLEGAQLEVGVAEETQLSFAVLGGGLRGDNLLDVVATIVNQVLDQECTAPATIDAPCGCPAPELTELVAALDAGGQCHIDAAAITVADLEGTMFEPDVDLFDGDELYPGQDGIVDSLSFGLGFHAVGATFAPPTAPGCR